MRKIRTIIRDVAANKKGTSVDTCEQSLPRFFERKTSKTKNASLPLDDEYFAPIK